jgi:hypothetical protein
MDPATNGSNAGANLTLEEILASRARLPRHVVYRPFVSETVLLNLETGLYHGVNPVGGRMLEALEAAVDVRTAAAALANEFGVPRAQIERDIAGFCAGLLERKLIELGTP